MKYFWVVLFITFSSALNAQSEVKTASFFFKPTEATLLPNSVAALDTFLTYIQKHQVEIKEVNSYSSKEGKIEVNQYISQQRLLTVTSKIEPLNKIGKKNNYGVNYPKIVPYPVTAYDKWRRVDVIYIEIKSPELVVEAKTSIPEKSKPAVDPKFFEETKKLSAKEELESKVLEPGMVFSIELKIQFYDGTHTLTPNSYPEIQELADYLLAHPNVSAYIRGHVCCGKAMKLSKQRAKVVYTELINKGVKKKRLRYQGFSNKLPLVSPERTEEDRRKNRRVDIIFSVED